MVRILKIPMGVPDWGSRELLIILRHTCSTGSRNKAAKLEERICDQFGVKYCVSTDLGRQAITLALAALGINRGDGVIIPSLFCQSAILPVLRCGCVPQFADIGQDLNISPEGVLRALNAKTRVIIVPHLYGQAAPIEEILHIANRHGVSVIDDAAQAMGAKCGEKYVGTFGDIGIFSFGPFKSIMATRGGALLTNNEKIYQKIRKHLPVPRPMDRPFIRALKSLTKFKLRKYSYFLIAANRRHRNRPKEKKELDFSETVPYCISPIDAAIALLQLDRLEDIVRRRMALANYLSKLLEECDWLETPAECSEEHVFVKYVIRMKSDSMSSLESDIRTTQNIIRYLSEVGIEAQCGYLPLHINEHFSGYCTRRLESTENIWKSLVCLPINPGMSFSDLRFMASCIKNFGSMRL
ncbi:MAG: DegT/DnrJ/EryC1/StrS family aminotransferase [Candidatus Hodarchaeota archaeon]